jgi:hypothetical protein
MPTTSTTVLEASDVRAAAAWHFDERRVSLPLRMVLAADALIRGVITAPQINLVLQPLDEKLLHNSLVGGRVHAVIVDPESAAPPVLLELRAASTERWIIAVATVDPTPEQAPKSVWRVFRQALLPAPLWPFAEVDGDRPVFVDDVDHEDPYGEQDDDE